MKNKKLLIASLAVAVVGIGYILLRKKTSAVTTATGIASDQTPAFTCPQGQVKCATSNKCYNPGVSYIVDPCFVAA